MSECKIHLPYLRVSYLWTENNDFVQKPDNKFDRSASVGDTPNDGSNDGQRSISNPSLQHLIAPRFSVLMNRASQQTSSSGLSQKSIQGNINQSQASKEHTKLSISHVQCVSAPSKNLNSSSDRFNAQKILNIEENTSEKERTNRYYSRWPNFACALVICLLCTALIIVPIALFYGLNRRLTTIQSIEIRENPTMRSSTTSTSTSSTSATTASTTSSTTSSTSATSSTTSSTSATSTTTSSTSTSTSETTTTTTTKASTITITSNTCVSNWKGVTILYQCVNCSDIDPYLQFTYTYVAIANATRISFSFREDLGVFALDDVSVRYVNSPITELLINGGFESGNLHGWSYCNPSSATAAGEVVSTSQSLQYLSYTYAARSGSYYYFDGAVGSADYLTQTFPTTIGYVYNISFWLVNEGDGKNSNANVLLSV